MCAKAMTCECDGVRYMKCVRARTRRHARRMPHPPPPLAKRMAHQCKRASKLSLTRACRHGTMPSKATTTTVRVHGSRPDTFLQLLVYRYVVQHAGGAVGSVVVEQAAAVCMQLGARPFKNHPGELACTRTLYCRTGDQTDPPGAAPGGRGMGGPAGGRARAVKKTPSTILSTRANDEASKVAHVCTHDTYRTQAAAW